MPAWRGVRTGETRQSANSNCPLTGRVGKGQPAPAHPSSPQWPLGREDVERGLEVDIAPFLDDPGYRVIFRPGHMVMKAVAVARGFLRRLADAKGLGRYDLLLVYREATPFGPPLVEARAQVLRIPILHDFDEAIFVPNIHPANRRWARLRSPGRLAAACRRASAVTVQNEFLAEFARGLNSRVTVIPTPVDTQARRPRAARAPGPVVIGWIGSDTTAPYLHLVDDALARVSAECEIVVRVVGGDYDNARLRRLEVESFVLEREQSDLERIDIGILPEPDDLWTRGKGGYKALLYMAAGVPVVASRVGVNPDIVVDGETGFCVSTTEEWVGALRRLALDADLRERLGRAGRERAVQRYSIDVITPLFAGALREAAETSHR